MIKGKRVLITGGGGFIGVSLAEHLAEHNQVILLDRDFEHNAWAYSCLRGHPRVQLLQGDILDTALVAHAAAEAHIIIHAAAVVGVPEVLYDPVRTLEINYLGTSHLLKAASVALCERFLFFSTSEIYGPHAAHVAEDTPIFLPPTGDARWSYTVSKVAGEHLAMAYHRQRGLPVVIVRPFNIFGPRRVGEHAILRFILHALEGKTLEVYGNGTQIRAWCYIDDLCQGVLRCLEAQEAIGQVFNLGNPHNAITVHELAKTVIRLARSPADISFKPLDFPDIVIRIPNIAKAQRILGFAPKIRLEEGLEKTIAWVQEHAGQLRQTLTLPRISAWREPLENGEHRPSEETQAGKPPQHNPIW